MFHLASFEDRLSNWKKFRDSIVTKENLVDLIIDYYSKAKLQSCKYDPWNNNKWPSPWELLSNNTYCTFSVLLGVGYTYLFASGTCEGLQLYFTKNNNNSTNDFILAIQKQFIIHGEITLQKVDKIPDYHMILKTETILNLN